MAALYLVISLRNNELHIRMVGHFDNLQTVRTVDANVKHQVHVYLIVLCHIVGEKHG